MFRILPYFALASVACMVISPLEKQNAEQNVGGSSGEAGALIDSGVAGANSSADGSPGVTADAEAGGSGGSVSGGTSGGGTGGSGGISGTGGVALGGMSGGGTGGLATGGISGGGAGGSGGVPSACAALDCDDSNPCTTDSCDQGVCSHEHNELDCTDDDDECTTDVCNGGICVHPANGSCDCREASDCDDSNPCTNDACTNNKCAYVNNENPCSDDANECTTDVCTDGVCRHPERPLNAACASDNDACTDDVCNGPLCTHPDNGSCECQDATDCNDNNPCTADDCVGTSCSYTNTTAPCASDNNACTYDVCSSGTCTHPPNTAPCTADTNPCTEDVCSNGLCTHAGTSTANVPCTNDNNPCTDDVCAANATGACTHVNNTAPCADEVPSFGCTNDVCAAGACTHVDNGTCECISEAQCNDSNSCTADSCSNLGVCQHQTCLPGPETTCQFGQPAVAGASPTPPDANPTVPMAPAPSVTQTPTNIDYSWGATGPLGTDVAFVARCTFTLYPQATGYYTFYVRRNDGARLYWPFTVSSGVPTASPTGTYSLVSGATSDQWIDHTGTAAYLEAAISTPVLLTAGSAYEMTALSYFNPSTAAPANNVATTSLLWSATTDQSGTTPLIALQVIPPANFAP